MDLDVAAVDPLHEDALIDQLPKDLAEASVVDPSKGAKRRERLSGPHLRAYDRAIEWARMGTIEADELTSVTAETTKNPA
jgi:hypothetical protein